VQLFVCHFVGYIPKIIQVKKMQKQKWSRDGGMNSWGKVKGQFLNYSGCQEGDA